MNELLRALLTRRFILKQEDPVFYGRIRRDQAALSRQCAEHMGWRLIVTDRLAKLEKIPAAARPHMGISEFTSPMDYVLLCAILAYLEEMDEGRQFLLSELVSYVSALMEELQPLDLTQYTQRKALVRVLHYVQQEGLLKLSDGTTRDFERSEQAQVLYENTGISRSFAVRRTLEFADCKTYLDFERARPAQIDADRGQSRTQRIYRGLLLSPMLEWASREEPDMQYLRSQRGQINRWLQEQLGGELQVQDKCAFWLLEDSDRFGLTHPSGAMLSDLVLLLCTQLRERFAQEQTPVLSREAFSQLVSDVRARSGSGFSKGMREQTQEDLEADALQYLVLWQLLEPRPDGSFRITPAAFKFCGQPVANWERKDG